MLNDILLFYCYMQAENATYYNKYYYGQIKNG